MMKYLFKTKVELLIRPLRVKLPKFFFRTYNFSFISYELIVFPLIFNKNWFNKTKILELILNANSNENFNKEINPNDLQEIIENGI